MKVVVDEQNFALYFSRSPIPFLREDGEAASDTVYYKHIGLYVYDREFLLNYAKMPQTPLEKAERLEQCFTRRLEPAFNKYLADGKTCFCGGSDDNPLSALGRLLDPSALPDPPTGNTGTADKAQQEAEDKQGAPPQRFYPPPRLSSFCLLGCFAKPSH